MTGTLQITNEELVNLHLNDKTAIVTGASRGLGLATVCALAAEGVRVLGAARTITPELSETAAATLAVDLSRCGAGAPRSLVPGDPSSSSPPAGSSAAR